MATPVLSACVAALALTLAGCAAHAPPRRGPLEPVPGDRPAARPPVQTARVRPPAPPLPPRVRRPDDGPLTAKIRAATPPSRAAALRLTEQARVLLARGEGPRAVELLERAIAIDARVPYAYYFLAEIHYHGDRPGLAHALLDRAEQMLVGAPYWIGQVRALRGLVNERQGRMAAARRAYQGALAVWPDDARARAGLARVVGSEEGVP